MKYVIKVTNENKEIGVKSGYILVYRLTKICPGVPVNKTFVTSVDRMIAWQLDNLITNECFDNKLQWNAGIGSLLAYLGYLSRLDFLDQWGHSGQLGHLGQLGHYEIREGLETGKGSLGPKPLWEASFRSY